MAARRIVVCCDGTWCGSATTGTTTNVKLLADCLAGRELIAATGFSYASPDGLLAVRYFEGVGLAGSFADYLLNGAIANDIADACTNAYRFIVDSFREGDRVWMFGLSRGAHTVRSVAGMINNWGVLDSSNPAVQAKTDIFCQAVYSNYRNKADEYAPSSAFAVSFKQKFSHVLNYPPIRFLGLLDTVGALGVPTINAGVGPSYEFYNQVVSAEVENVFQALSAHDRLSVFEPCYVRRDGQGHVGLTEEVWFTGSHYDLGRQRFVFPRDVGSWWELALNFLSNRFNLLGTNIEPTVTCSAAALTWLLNCIQRVEPAALQPGQRDGAIARCLRREWLTYRFPLWPVATRDAYDVLSGRFVCACIRTPFSRVALANRNIPAYQGQAFYSANGAPDSGSYAVATSGFMSRAFDVYMVLNPGGARWENGV